MRKQTKDAIMTLLLDLGFCEGMAELATRWARKYGYSSKMAVLANGNPELPDDVTDLCISTTEEYDDPDYRY